MNTTSSPTRALVLGGGGSAGNAWLIGVTAGLLDGGVDLPSADLIIGTSAGATAAAQLTSPTRPPELYASILAAPTPPTGGRPGAASAGQVTNHLERFTAITAASTDAADMRRRVGAAALEQDATSDGSGSARWRSTVAGRLPGLEWPEQRILITAIDAHTGEPAVFDRESGVGLIDAVAASTSNGFGVAPFPIDGRRYLDGGYRRNENADLAEGYERVVILSPLSGRTLHPLEWGMQLDAQVGELRASGSAVEVILPDADSLAAFGDNMMDLSRRPAAARAGFAQGLGLASTLAGFWG